MAGGLDERGHSTGGGSRMRLARSTVSSSTGQSLASRQDPANFGKHCRPRDRKGVAPRCRATLGCTTGGLRTCDDFTRRPSQLAWSSRTACDGGFWAVVAFLHLQRHMAWHLPRQRCSTLVSVCASCRALAVLGAWPGLLGSSSHIRGRGSRYLVLCYMFAGLG